MKASIFILSSLLLFSFAFCEKKEVKYQKREFVPINPINKKEVKVAQEQIILPQKDHNYSGPESSLFPTPALDFD